MKDWREDNIICEHVYEDQKKGNYRMGFRVCCKKCSNLGFLDTEQFLDKVKRFGLCVGTMRRPIR